MDISKRFNDFIFSDNELDDFILFEHAIFYEYQHLGYNQYIQTVMHELLERGAKQDYIEYMRYNRRSIAVYAGSFNPFHRGHYNILIKAEQIFDKVIIARGINPEKNNKNPKMSLWSFNILYKQTGYTFFPFCFLATRNSTTTARTIISVGRSQIKIKD